MGVEVMMVSAAYLSVMAGVFARGVQAALRTHRDARELDLEE